MIAFVTLSDFVLRLTVTLGAGLVIATILRKASAAERHLVLTTVLSASLLLPAGLLLVPHLSVAVPVSGRPSVLQTAVLALAEKPLAPAVPPAPKEQQGRAIPLPGWTDCLLLIAAVGTLAQMARMICGLLSLRDIRRQAALFAVPEPTMLAARRIAGLGYLPPVCLAASDPVPFLHGWLHPCLILPAEAGTWPEQRLVMVLAHEMAHIRRRDHLWQPVLLLFRLLYWWHPFARLALAQTLRERESACDDIVLSGNVNAGDYAQLLVETATASRFCRPLPPIALAMASASQITGRVRKILGTNRRRVAPSRLLFVLVPGVALVLLAPVTVMELHAEEKNLLPEAAPTSSSKSPEIQIELKMLQISEEIYQQNRTLFDSAIKSQTANDFLRQLNNMKGVDLVSAPKITMRSGQRGTIEIVREFPFPVAFDKDRVPTSFETRTLGPTFEITSSENNGKIRLDGTFFYTEFLGFVENGGTAPQTPAFQTREAHFLREQASGVPSLLFVPWQKPATGLLSAVSTQENASTSPSTTERLLLFITASFVKDPAVVVKSNRSLLRETILHGLDYHDTPLRKVIDDLFAVLSQRQTSNPPLSFSEFLNDPVPEFTFKARAVSVEDLLAEIEKQTGYTYRLDAVSLAIFRREPLPNEDIPFGSPVPNKPGFVFSPYAPKSGYVDLRGFQRGMEVKCPYTGRPFLAP